MNFFAEAAAARDRIEADLPLIARIPVEEVQRLASDIAIVCKWTRLLEDDTAEQDQEIAGLDARIAKLEAQQ